MLHLQYLEIYVIWSDIVLTTLWKRLTKKTFQDRVMNREGFLFPCPMCFSYFWKLRILDKCCFSWDLRALEFLIEKLWFSIKNPPRYLYGINVLCSTIFYISLKFVIYRNFTKNKNKKIYIFIIIMLIVVLDLGYCHRSKIHIAVTIDTEPMVP